MASTKSQPNNLLVWQYIALPLVFLLVTLLGGMRLSLESDAFIFLGPSLFNLVLAVMLVAVIVRGRIVDIGVWFSPDFPVTKNLANGLVLVTMAAASAQVINCVLPEKGFTFLLVSFFLLWSLWTNLFAELAAGKLLRSLAALLSFAFIFKYVFLASFVSTNDGWARKLTESFLQGISLGLLDIPKFAPATGYIAFFTMLMYGAGLLLAVVISYPPVRVPDTRLIDADDETTLVVVKD
jgi:hypothetical protein